MKEPEYNDSIIVNRPDLRTKSRLLTEWGLTVAGWILWFFLVRPFILLLAWMIGYKLFYIHMIKYRGFENIHLFFKYGAVILVIYLVMQGWNLYNARRFRGKERRTRPKDATDDDMAGFFEMAVEDIRCLKQCRRVDVDFPENTRIVFDSPSFDGKLEGRFAPHDLGEKVVTFK